MAGYRAAIDFGTSYTVATSQASPQAAPTILALVDEGRLSSAVALDDAGKAQAGPSVEDVAALAPDRVERTPKRCLDQPDVMLGGQPVQTVDLVAAVLQYIHEELLRHFNGHDPDELCLTHPARWETGDPRMQRLEAAARQVGFAALRLLPEPCAAALALAAAGQLDEVGEGELVAVYDLGGGTFDIALLSRVSGRGFELTGEPGGDQELGGEWLDDRLYERLSSQLPPDDEASLRDPGRSPDPLLWRRAGFVFRQGIRRAKERLSREVNTQIALYPPFTLDRLPLTRAELELTAMPLINKSADRFDLFLQRNGRTPGDLAAICLVGGSSRLTVVNRIIGERFGRPVATHGDPKAVTALGALSEILAAASRASVTSRAKPSLVKQGHPAGSGTDAPGSAAPGRTFGVGERSAAERSTSQQVEDLYDEALAAYWTEQYDRAVELLQEVLAARPDHPEANSKLEQARRQQQVTTNYARACAAADVEDWEHAVAAFVQVSEIEPGYRDVAVKLADARQQQQIAALRAEARRLYEARQWAAVVKVGERFRALNSDAADLDDLMTSARTELAAAEHAERIAGNYRAALRMLDAGSWQQAADALEKIAEESPGYRDTSALLARARSLAGGPKQPQPDARGIAERPKAVQTFHHDAVINAVAFGADRRWLATSTTGGQVVIWDTTTGKQHRLLAHYAWAVLFSADGRWLVTADKRTVRIWDATTGKQLLSVRHKSSRDRAIALTPDSRWLATSRPGNTVGIWDTADSHALMTISLDQLSSIFAPPNGVDGLAFSADGRWLAAASTDKTARIWDAATGRPILKVTHGGAVSAVAFSPDGRWLATASTDKTARIWDAATGRPILKVTHGGAVSAVAFSPDGRWLATASTDKTARIWDAATGQKLAEVRHEDAVRSVVFSSDGDCLATASRRSAQIWALCELAAHQLIGELPGTGQEVVEFLAVELRLGDQADQQ
jgi:tetratricopeptide (TPR) repeat protein